MLDESQKQKMGNKFAKLEKRMEEQAIAHEKHLAKIELMMHVRLQERKREKGEIKEVINKNRKDINSIARGMKVLHENAKNRGLDDDVMKNFMSRMSLTNEALAQVLQ